MTSRRGARELVTAGALVIVVAASIAVWSLGGSSPEKGLTSDDRDRVPMRGYLESACELPARWVTYLERGWYARPNNGWDLIVVPRPPNYVGTLSSPSAPHGGPYEYLQEVPFIFYGPGHIKPLGAVRLDREVTLADIAPTQAELIGASFPARDGSPVREVLETGSSAPRLIVLASIDGGGWNVFRRWQGEWPHISRLIQEGASIADTAVGSSPSITPPAHTTMSTGTFPETHGVTGIRVRGADGSIVGGFAPEPNNSGAESADPTINLLVPTLADLWDRQSGNEAEVALISAGNYALGMLGYGAAMDGGDRDIAAMAADDETWKTNPTFYSLPEYVNSELAGPEEDLEAVDKLDGQEDGQWRGHDIPLEGSPAFSTWENRIALEILGREGFGTDSVTDLVYMHYKAPDIAGHLYNMIAPEQGDVIRSVDTAIGELTAWLDENVGPRNYVIMITADHGQTPIDQGGYPINQDEMISDMVKAVAPDASIDQLVEHTSGTSLFVNKEGMKKLGVTPEQAASFLSRYTLEENLTTTEPPPEFEDRLDEKVFSAVFPGRSLDEVSKCVAPSR